MLVRTDPKRGRLAYLSIPRDLRVDVPGLGAAKINAAFQVGGAALASRTMRDFTGLPINHVAVVDFGSFARARRRDRRDRRRRAGADHLEQVRLPARRRRRACDRWPGWRFGRGEQQMDGRRALVYARIRENQLDPSENDITRGERQQAVLDGDHATS